MRLNWISIPAASLFVFLNSCANNGGGLASNNPTGTGPFDARGNYVEAWADSPSQWRKGSTQQAVEATPDQPAADVPVSPAQFVVVETTPKPVVESTSTMVVYKKPTTRPDSVESNSIKPKPKAAVKKPVVKKAVVKAKPKSSRYTVRSGDNLYNIAKRNGTTVGAIQKANGIKGANIRPGQTMVIPR